MNLLDQLQLCCWTGRERKDSQKYSQDPNIQKQNEKNTIKNCKKKKLKQRKPWQKQEDSKLIELYQQYPQNWQQISKLMEDRSGKQIRDRYINALDPNINRNEWTHEEDLQILYKYIDVGSKWSVIAQFLKGRPENMIKNRFYSSIKKKISKGDFQVNFKNLKKFQIFKKVNLFKLKTK